jgi:hypothetical protein
VGTTEILPFVWNTTTGRIFTFLRIGHFDSPP